MEEEWRDVVGWESYYQVSNIGNIRSKLRPRLPPKIKSRRQRGNNILKHVINGKGYPCVNLTGAGRRKQLLVHVAMLEAFVGHRPHGMDGCHNDGNPMNVSLSNFRWDTRKSNHADKKLHGRWQCCESANNAKLTLEVVKKLRIGEISDLEAAKLCNVTLGTAKKARSGASWKLSGLPPLKKNTRFIKGHNKKMFDAPY